MKVSTLLLIVGLGLGSTAQAAEVKMVDPKTRQHLKTELHTGDYIALSEAVTNKMLSAKLVQRWTESQKVIVAIPRNNTDKEDIRMSDLQDRISETLLNSGQVRLMGQQSTDFNYIIRSELTSTRQRGERKQEIVFYTLQLKMFTLTGELVGQWSDDIAMAKGKKRRFF